MIIFVGDSYQTQGTHHSVRICFIASNNQLLYNHDSPASKKPCLMPSFEHPDVAISGRTNKKSIYAFFFDDFKLKNSNLSEWNMSLMSLFIGHLSTGMSLTVCILRIFFTDLNTCARSAGCSSPDQAAFCLLAMILFSTYRSTDCLMASICYMSPSHHATTVALLGMVVPALISKSQYFIRRRLISSMRICSW